MSKSKKAAPTITLPADEVVLETPAVDPQIEETLKGGVLTVKEIYEAQIPWKFVSSDEDGHKYLTYDPLEEESAVRITRMAAIRNKSYDGFIRDALQAFIAQSGNPDNKDPNAITLDEAAPIEDGFVIDSEM